MSDQSIHPGASHFVNLLCEDQMQKILKGHAQRLGLRPAEVVEAIKTLPPEELGAYLGKFLYDDQFEIVLKTAQPDKDAAATTLLINEYLASNLQAAAETLAAVFHAMEPPAAYTPPKKSSGKRGRRAENAASGALQFIQAEPPAKPAPAEVSPDVPVTAQVLGGDPAVTAMLAEEAAAPIESLPAMEAIATIPVIADRPDAVTVFAVTSDAPVPPADIMPPPETRPAEPPYVLVTDAEADTMLAAIKTAGMDVEAARSWWMTMSDENDRKFRALYAEAVAHLEKEAAKVSDMLKAAPAPSPVTHVNPPTLTANEFRRIKAVLSEAESYDDRLEGLWKQRSSAAYAEILNEFVELSAQYEHETGMVISWTGILSDAEFDRMLDLIVSTGGYSESDVMALFDNGTAASHNIIRDAHAQAWEATQARPPVVEKPTPPTAKPDAPAPAKVKKAAGPHPSLTNPPVSDLRWHCERDEDTLLVMVEKGHGVKPDIINLPYAEFMDAVPGKALKFRFERGVEAAKQYIARYLAMHPDFVAARIERLIEVKTEEVMQRPTTKPPKYPFQVFVYQEGTDEFYDAPVKKCTSRSKARKFVEAALDTTLYDLQIVEFVFEE